MDYLIPANSKKSQLIFSLFRPIDLLILVSGGAATLLLMFIFKGDTVTELVIKLSPIAVCGLLVMPVAFYHNALVFLQEMYAFFTKQNKYLWRGWCAWYGGIDEETKN